MPGTTLIKREINISETEARCAVYHYHYRLTSTKTQFVESVMKVTSFPRAEVEFAWELIDYNEWLSGPKGRTNAN